MKLYIKRKTLLALGLAAITGLSFAEQTQHRVDTVIALSPMQSQASATAERSLLLKSLSQMPLGSTTILMDGDTQSTLCTFTVPNNDNYNAPKTKLKHNRQCLIAMSKFVQTRSKAMPYTAHGLDMPALLRFVSETYATDGLDLVVLGSLLYHKDNEPNTSMRNASIPSDGHINANAAASVFSTAGKAKSLKGVRVHFAYTDTQKILNAQHAHFLRRFWTLYVEAFGANMVSYYADSAVVFDRVSKRAVPPSHNYVMDDSPKLEMLRIRRASNQQPVFDRAVTTEAMPADIFAQAENVEVAIQWSCARCDLDLYVQPWDGAQILYFGRKNTAQGQLWKDFTNSPRASSAWEMVTFNVPLDLSRMVMAINFFSGEAKNGIDGVLRLSASGHTFETPFKIKASKGTIQSNISTSFDTGSAQSPATIVLRPSDFVPLETNQANSAQTEPQ